MEHVTQAFPSDVRQLSAVRALVREVCRRAAGAADEAGLAQLELAVAEAAANVILHAYAGKSDLPFEVVIEAEPSGVCVSLYHQGEPFDPQQVPPPSFDGSRESGFGLYLIHNTVDECVFFQDERGHHGIRLFKKW
jgi:serine/threonine-protein kinase RsbW